MFRAIAATMLVAANWAGAAQPDSTAAASGSRTINLPTSKLISVPVPGFVTRTNSFPAAIAVSPDGRFAAILNQGYGTEASRLTQSIGVLDLRTNQYRDFPDPRLRGDEKSTLQSYFIGLAFASDGTRLYASLSATSKSAIGVYRFGEGRLELEKMIELPLQTVRSGRQRTYELAGQGARVSGAYPAGIAVLPGEHERLLVADHLSDNALLLDLASGRVLRTFDLGSVSAYLPREFPYTIIADRSGRHAFVSEWNDSAVVELDLTGTSAPKRLELRRAGAGSGPSDHPTTLLLSPDERTLYVAVSNATQDRLDGIAAFDLASGTLARLYRTGLGTGDGGGGSVPIGLALSPDGKRLFATSAAQNAVAVFDLSEPLASSKEPARPIGFIPTEWYPSAVAISGNDLLIASAKGEGAGPNNMAPSVLPTTHPLTHPYIPSLMAGALQRVPLEGLDRQLPELSREVARNNLLLRRPEKIVFAKGRNPIRHVIYILKENRTYDQLFGDLAVGDGDPSLVMYGADVTPNLHRLAMQFGVADNFYDSGEVSANGHLWSDGAASSDYMEDIWPSIYRGGERPDSYGNALDQGVPDPDDPGTGFIWDKLAKRGLSYRIYGEMVETIWCRDQSGSSPREGTPSASTGRCPSPDIKLGEPLPAGVGTPPGSPSPWPWSVPRFRIVKPTKAAQRLHIDPNYPDFSVDYPDQLRADEFLREFRRFVAARGSPRELPAFSLVYLPNDHTGGTRAGWPSPRASIADNDLAVGRIVDAVSHSAYWNDTAIFVLEDDAQNGADHVDAHRSIALVISKYAPRGKAPLVDHHFYTTVGMVHTVEALLGLPPMNLFDAHAPIMAPLFAGAGDQPAYTADNRNLANGMLYEVNKPTAPGAKQSAKLDLSRPDAADTATLNAILWQDAKGAAPARPSGQ